MKTFKAKSLQEITISGDNHGSIVQKISISGLDIKNQLPRLLPPIESYIGHQDDLSAIRKCQLDGKKIIILNGLGGIGKTEFSRYFGAAFFPEKSYYLNFNKSIRGTFLDCRQFLSFNEAVSVDPSNQSASFWEVMRWLCGILDKDSLLVIDNVTNLEEFDILFRLACYVFLTTRLLCESINHSSCIKLSLPLLTEAECAALFQSYCCIRNKRPFSSEEQDAILKIVQLVNRHTLTLELLAKTCSKANLNPEQLLARLEYYGFSLGGIDEKVTKNNDVTNRTFLEHMQKLFDVTEILHKEGAHSLLSQLSVLKLDGLEIQYVKDLLQLTNLNLIYELEEYGWINIRQGKIFMHQVVSAIIKSRLNPGIKDLKPLLNSLNSKLPNRIKDLEGLEPYVSQANHLLRYLEGSRHKTVCEISAKLGKIFYYTGQWHESKFYFEYCIKNDRRLFLFHRLYWAGLYSDMGRTCKALAQYSLAMEYYNKALSMIKYAKKDNPLFAELYSNMAIVYYQQDNDYEKTIQLLNQARDIQENAHGADSHLTAAIYNYLGLAYRAVGDYKTALDCFEQKALPIQRRYYGEDSYFVAETTNNLAGVYRRLKDYPQALKLYRSALETRTKKLGSKHPDLATSYNNIGILYRDIEDWDSSITYLKQAISIYEEVPGKEHPYTAAAYFNIAKTYLGKKDFPNALHYALLAKDIKEKLYPSTNQSILAAYQVLIQAYEGMEQWDCAEEYRSKAGLKDTSN